MSGEGPRPAYLEALRLLDRRQYPAAIAALNRLLADGDGDDPGGSVHALLGVAYFQLEQYDRAAAAYQSALERDPAPAQWREMLAQAQANATAEVHAAVPEPWWFEGRKLLAPPLVAPGSLPEPPPPPPAAGIGTRLRLLLGNVLGAAAAGVMDSATLLWGKLAGYRDELWTNWYRRPYLLGILTLAYMRRQLNRNNLKSSYPPDTLIGFQAAGQTPPAGVTHFRTADGTWNNLADPKEGAAGTRFPRNVANSAIRPETGPALMTPNPRALSRLFLARDGAMQEVPFLNLLAASWINFQNHDWIHHGDVVTGEVHEVPLAVDDPARSKYRQTKMFVGKTQPDPTRRAEGEQTPVSFINAVTHWWDGSQIYGSDQATVDRLRRGVDGMLKLDARGLLPVDEKGIEKTGFTPNWWVGLAMLHTLFSKEHNAICAHLKQAYSSWDDTRLFNVARLINAAVMAKIHSVEWTPAILPNRVLDAGLNANWYGLLTNLFASGPHPKTVAQVNVRNPELGGVVGNPIDKHGQPFGLTEEFVEVYRLHSLLPETIHLRQLGDGGGDGAVEKIPFVETRQAGSAKLTARVPMADLFYSFGNQHPGQLVLNNYPTFLRELSIPGNPVFDMGAVDILRARERGVPRYNEFRRQLGLNPIAAFADLTDDREQVRKLEQAYADVEQLDLMIGTLAEGHRPHGFGFGETLFQIFILNATRRLQADRFYTDCYNEQTYTPEGLAWIDQADLKTVLLRHYPQLATSGLANIKNAFEPWDRGARLAPERHPLRAFDRALQPDPWRGDA